MKIAVNGKNRKVEARTLEELMTFLKYDLGRTLVSVNGNVVGKDKYSRTILAEGDKVEAFSFVGGG
ncbi:MAG: sulfur carrier protein ThiS [Victivallales bacterium]|jgi:sulfur carrier protein